MMRIQYSCISNKTNQTGQANDFKEIEVMDDLALVRMLKNELDKYSITIHSIQFL